METDHIHDFASSGALTKSLPSYSLDVPYHESFFKLGQKYQAQRVLDWMLRPSIPGMPPTKFSLTRGAFAAACRFNNAAAANGLVAHCIHDPQSNRSMMDHTPWGSAWRYFEHTAQLVMLYGSIDVFETVYDAFPEDKYEQPITQYLRGCSRNALPEV